MTACATVMLDRSAGIFSPASNIRTSLPGSSRTMTNHGPPRNFSGRRHQAAAIVTFLSPGLRFFHQGQFEGARLRVPTHLGRGPDEPANPEISAFYTRLLTVLKGLNGRQQLRFFLHLTIATRKRLKGLGEAKASKLLNSAPSG
jgi:hypothetical protein